MKKLRSILEKVVGMSLFFLGIFMMIYSGTEAGQADALARAEHLPSSTALVTSWWFHVSISFMGMMLYCFSVVTEE